MPANLTPEFIKKRDEYRQAATDEERLRLLREMFRLVPKHKGTEKIQAEIKSKIARLRSQPKRSIKRGFDLFYIPKEGAGQVVMLGMPNTGKSSLLRCLTNASPDVAPYPYSTRHPTPGMMAYEDILIQIVDIPPLGAEHVEGNIINMVRCADAVLIVVDLSEDPLDQMQKTFNWLDLKQVRVCAQGEGEDTDDLSLEYTKKPGLIVANKLDTQDAKETYELFCELYHGGVPVIPISSTMGNGILELKQGIFEMLEIIRVYTKTPGGKADLENPIILKRGANVSDAARAIHKDFSKRLQFARVFRGTEPEVIRTKGHYLLQDKDIVEFHI
jgi:hypothetical protein